MYKPTTKRLEGSIYVQHNMPTLYVIGALFCLSIIRYLYITWHVMPNKTNMRIIHERYWGSQERTNVLHSYRLNEEKYKNFKWHGMANLEDV